jgi:hypothetical protein
VTNFNRNCVSVRLSQHTCYMPSSSCSFLHCLMPQCSSQHPRLKLRHTAVTAVLSGKHLTTFRRILLPPSSGSKFSLCLCLLLSRCFLRVLFDPEHGFSTLLRNVFELIPNYLASLPQTITPVILCVASWLLCTAF